MSRSYYYSCLVYPVSSVGCWADSKRGLTKTTCFQGWRVNKRGARRGPAQFQPCPSSLSPPSPDDDECKAVWPRHNGRARLLEPCGATRAAPPVIPTARPPDFPGVQKQKLIGWPLDWSLPPPQLHLNHPTLLRREQNMLRPSMEMLLFSQCCIFEISVFYELCRFTTDLHYSYVLRPDWPSWEHELKHTMKFKLAVSCIWRYLHVFIPSWRWEGLHQYFRCTLCFTLKGYLARRR